MADGAKASESSSGTLLCFCTQILKKDNHPPQTRARPDGNVVSNHHEVRLVKVANVFFSLLRLSASVTAAPYFFINCDP